MATYNFTCPATETLHGTAFFTVDAPNEREARRKLAADASEYFNEFCESTGGTEWEAKAQKDWELT